MAPQLTPPSAPSSAVVVIEDDDHDDDDDDDDGTSDVATIPTCAPLPHGHAGGEEMMDDIASTNAIIGTSRRDGMMNDGTSTGRDDADDDTKFAILEARIAELERRLLSVVVVASSSSEERGLRRQRQRASLSRDGVDDHDGNRDHHPDDNDDDDDDDDVVSGRMRRRGDDDHDHEYSVGCRHSRGNSEVGVSFFICSRGETGGGMTMTTTTTA